MAQSAVVQGKLHLFGGEADKKRIARLDDCNFVELPYKLNFDGYDGHAALSITENSEALICFDYTTWKFCDVFTGSSVDSTHSTSYRHRYAGLGFYNGQPTTVGSYYSDGYRKVETLSSTGWMSLADSPINTILHTLIGLKNDMLMIGGTDIVKGLIKSHVWRLSGNSWSQEADLKQKVYYGTAMAIGNSIIISGKSDGAVQYTQRIVFEENDEIAGVEQIAVYDGSFYNPALFLTSQDYCNSD